MSTINIGDRVSRRPPALRGQVIGLEGPHALVLPDDQENRIVSVELADLDNETARAPTRARAAMNYDQLEEATLQFVAVCEARGARPTCALVKNWLVEHHGTSPWIADHTVRLAIARGNLTPYEADGLSHALRVSFNMEEHNDGD